MWGRLLLLFVAIANKILLSILGVLLKSYRPLCALVSYTINESSSTSLNIKVRVIVKVRIRDNFLASLPGDSPASSDSSGTLFKVPGSFPFSSKAGRRNSTHSSSCRLHLVDYEFVSSYSQRPGWCLLLRLCILAVVLVVNRSIVEHCAIIRRLGKDNCIATIKC